jgi:hypothetical protein
VFAPLKETVPVFEGRFRLTVDVTLAGGKELEQVLGAPAPILEVAGSLDYQVCSDRKCYPPGTLPLRWGLKLVPLDRERAPEALRRKPTH